MTAHGFKSLAHPLSQIEAAEEIFSNASAFVQDEWEDLYKDPPPDEDEVYEWLNPFEVLGYLSACELRFEAAGSDRESVELGEGYWTSRFSASTTDVLIHSWLFKLKDRLEIDPRVVDHGFMYTDLIVIPDPDGVAASAYDLVLQSMGLTEEVKERVKAEEEVSRRNFRSTSVIRVARTQRGEGPRTSNLVLADKAALALRDAGSPLSAGEVAELLATANVASVNTTLHQMSAKRKPKRLAGWVRYVGDGRYAWAVASNQHDDESVEEPD